MPVLGMGGLFFRARNPEELGAWYVKHLGVGPGCAGDPLAEANPWVWMAQGGPLVFSPFAESSDYFAADRRFMPWRAPRRSACGCSRPRRAR